MTDPLKEANEALEAASARVNDPSYMASETSTKNAENLVRLASAHAQVAMARQAEVKNLLQARKDFADFPLALSDVNDRLFGLLGI